MTPIERAARAMHASAAPEWEWDEPMCEPLRTIYRQAARAMLLALRAPTDLMIHQGLDAMESVADGPQSHAHLCAAYAAMIDAALAQDS
jgi:hypothetical protein